MTVAGLLRRSWLTNPHGFLARRLGVKASLNLILASDRSKHTHDHSQPYIEIVLEGGFTEVRIHETLIEAHRYACRHRAEHGMPQVRHNEEMGRWESHAFYGAGSILVRKAADAHRLVLERGTMATTLHIAAGKAQTWGYHTPSGKVAWHDYLSYQDKLLADFANDAAKSVKPAQVSA